MQQQYKNGEAKSSRFCIEIIDSDKTLSLLYLRPVSAIKPDGCRRYICRRLSCPLKYYFPESPILPSPWIYTAFTLTRPGERSHHHQMSPFSPSSLAVRFPLFSSFLSNQYLWFFPGLYSFDLLSPKYLHTASSMLSKNMRSCVSAPPFEPYHWLS